MAYLPIQASEVAQGAVLDATTLNKIKNNFDFQQTELEEKETALATQATLINKTVPVGTVMQSLLTQAQLNAEGTGTWLLMNGQSCLGTTYATITGNTTVPNAMTEGTFFRQAKTGRALGSYEADAFGAHSHTWTFGNNPGGSVGACASNGTPTTNGSAGSPATSTVGGTETRPKNIALNYFVKVEY